MNKASSFLQRNMDIDASSGRLSSHPSSLHRAPAKLNVRLKVTGLRPDGYHDVVSIMVPVALYDRIELRVTPHGRIDLSCEGFPAPCDQENLVCRAARAFYSKTGIEDGVSIRLTKNIPVAAGLGGGSSDAACVLKVLNRHYASPLTLEELKELAVGLGADVPFFLIEGPCIARGIGGILEPIEVWPKLWYIIITPPILVSTAWVYRNLKARPVSNELQLTREPYQYIINYLNRKPFDVKALLENDLERVTINRFPVIEGIKQRLIRAGADGALMSGSGPSVFGVYHLEDVAIRAKAALAGSHPGDLFLVEGLV